MEGIEKITAKIAQDAQAEIDRLDRETQEQIDALSAQTRAQSDRECSAILERGRAAAQERLERLSSAARCPWYTPSSATAAVRSGVRMAICPLVPRKGAFMHSK